MKSGLKGASSPRKSRADAQRNRTALLSAAKDVFASKGPGASLEEVARRAGVGIGTLYRHFSTRDALIESVYRRELEQLAGSARELTETLDAGEALHAWMLLFVDYVATKKVLASALCSTVPGATQLAESSRAKVLEAITSLVRQAAAGGDIRDDVEPGDLLRALAGFTYEDASPGWQRSANRLIDLLMNGLRSRP